MKRQLKSNLSGNEVYYTSCSLVVILKNSCSKLDRQKVLIQFPLHIRFGGGALVGRSLQQQECHCPHRPGTSRHLVQG